MKVDLNCDLGESFGIYKIGRDEEILKYISSANIACGWHAGDSTVMDRTIKLAKKNRVAIGAHPGYPDLIGFGRRKMEATHHEIKTYIKYQVGALYGFAKSESVEISHIKPHGAMYNLAAKDYNISLAIAEAIKEIDRGFVLLGLANSEMIRAGRDVGINVASEVFADREYNDDGTLVSRDIEGSVIHNKKIAILRVIRMIKEGKVKSINGKDINICADSICVHGDNVEALEFVKEIRTTLEKESISIESFVSR